MSPIQGQIPPHKRQHTEANLLDASSDVRPSKRSRREIKLHSAAFYDSLSKVWLTRRALKELDRRTKHVNNCSEWPDSARWKEYQGDSWKKRIQRFARHGGPGLGDLRGYPEPKDAKITRTMSSSHPSRSSGNRQGKSTVPTSHSSSKTSNRRSSAYDNDFEQHLIDHRIYIKGYEYPGGEDAPEPGTIDVLHDRLTQPRPSLSPSRFTNTDFRAFERNNDRLIDEGEVMRNVIPILAGDVNIPFKQDLLFTRLKPIADNTIVDAKPDLYDGASLADVDKRVRVDIGDYIIPTKHPTAPIVPNFFLEAKAPKGAADVAKRQACYDGALGARAMHQLQSYGVDEPVYDGDAYTISTTYLDGQLKMYTTHPTQASDGTTQYHMTQVRAFALTSDPNSFRQGATAFRNARDWTQEQRNNFISIANERARAMNAALVPLADNDILNTRDSQDSTYLPQAEDVDHKSQYIMSQQPFLQESSDDDDPAATTEAYTAEESESSPDELAIDTYETASNKRRTRSSGNTALKAARHDNGTRRRHRSKKEV